MKQVFSIKFSWSVYFRLTMAAGLLTLILSATGCQITIDWSSSPHFSLDTSNRQSNSDVSNADDILSLHPGYQQAISRITEGVKLDFLLNQDFWHSGDKIKALIRVTNTTDKPVPWQAGSTSFGPAGSIRAYIALQGTDILLLEDGEPRAGDTAMLYGQLEPGKSIEKTVVWTTSYTLNGDDILQAWTDDHTLHIVFTRGHEDSSSFMEWQHSIKIEADGDIHKTISRDQAIDIARTQPAYDSFRLAHSGDAVAKIEDGQYLVNFSGIWETASEECYQETQNKMMAPNASADWKTGTWTVIFSEKLGDPPNELVIVIDGYTGDVFSIN